MKKWFSKAEDEGKKNENVLEEKEDRHLKFFKENSIRFFGFSLIVIIILLGYSFNLANKNESLHKELDSIYTDLDSKNSFLFEFKSISTTSKSLQNEFVDITKEELEYLGYTSEEVSNIFKSIDETVQHNEHTVVDFIQNSVGFDTYDMNELNKLSSTIDSSNQTVNDVIKNGVNKKYAELSSTYDSIKLHEKASAVEAGEFKKLLPLIESGSLKSMIYRLHEIDILMNDNQALNEKVQNRVIAEEEAERQRIAAEQEAERQRVAAEQEAERQRVEAEQEAERQRVADAQASNNSGSSGTTSNSVYYKNCTAVRAAGAAPIYQGQPGYGTHLDRDRDGIGCE